MKNRKSTFAKTVGNLALVAGVLGAMTVVPKISSAAAAKPAAAMSAKKPAMAKKATAKTTQMTGTITGMKGDMLMVAPVQKKKGASKTIKVPAKAKVTINGKAAKLSQLKKGEKVTVKMMGTTVTSVSTGIAKKAAPKKAAMSMKKK